MPDEDGDSQPGFDAAHAHSARVYNYWMGGKENYAADREAAEQAIAANPGILADVRANRAFLARAVWYLAGECGVWQFLDIGTGLPTAGNTHEVAQATAQDARISYVDNDQSWPGCAHTARSDQTAGRERLRAPLKGNLKILTANPPEASTILGVRYGNFSYPERGKRDAQ